MFDAVTRTARQFMATAPAQPPAKPAEPRGAGRTPPPKGDTLDLSARSKPRTDGQPRQPLFDRLDADGSNRVSRAELDAWQGRKAARRDARAAVEGLDAPPAAPPAPPAPPAFGYQTKHAHGVEKLAQDFGVTPEDLMKANGWTDPGKQVPAGSKVNVPDSPETRARAAQYGGRVSEATPPGSLPAEPKPGEPGGLNAGGVGIAGDPNRVHMTQFVHEQWNNSPDAPWGSANCGPASLAMGLKAIGKEPAGLAPGADTEGWIDASRQAMGAMWDSAGRYGDSAYTDVSQVIAGAEASGAKATQVGWEGLDAALAAGHPVVVAGNPAAYNYNWVAEGISSSQYNGGHFITVTGMDANGNYVINDPLSNVGAVAIPPSEMYAYGAYFGWSASVELAP